ncbi:MAG: hypothetical protein WAT19_09620 [Ferruginibacter sp.]
MNLQEIFENIKESFCSLWTFKSRGRTLEVITPFSTTNSKFISVFITEQEEEMIVTDGGWLMNGEYSVVPDLDDEVFIKIFNHYQSQYEIELLQNDLNNFYYKKTKKQELIPNLVYDLSNFLSNVISTAQIQFQDEKEKIERESFSKEADGYLSGLVNKSNLKFRRELGEGYKNVRFNAIVSSGTKINLVKYITGSTTNYFLSSLTKATVDFEIANHSPFDYFVNNRVALINDSSDGFNQGKLYRYIETLEEHTKIPSVKWSERSALKTLLN